ncbi:hypothetical protein MYX84_11230 [Acidobacteria bacterium AH-259-O06]|nr:hypothetical protein [Acidobacteria bacterium AH-259-O06]
MSELGESPQQVEIVFEYDPHYQLIAANGIWGGLTPKGDLRIDFFVEYQAAPSPGSHTYQPTPDGTVEEKSKPEKVRKVVRRLQIGVLVSPQHIASFAQWFHEKAQEVEQLRKPAANKEGKVH